MVITGDPSDNTSISIPPSKRSAASEVAAYLSEIRTSE